MLDQVRHDGKCIAGIVTPDLIRGPPFPCRIKEEAGCWIKSGMTENASLRLQEDEL
ncbi:MAG TPA: hypothetical protein VF548_08360 [Allosphingosinicella sp.]